MAKSSSGFAWAQAGQALFRHLGLRRGLLLPETAEQLPQQLLGTGYEVFGGAVVAGAFPSATGIAGALAEQTDGTWLALAGGDAGFQVLDIAGKALRPLQEHEAQQCRHIWLVSASAVSLPGVSAFLRRYKGRFVDLFLCSLLINLFALALPLFSSFVYDKILGNGITATLWALVIGLLLMIGIEFGVRMIRIINAERFAVSSEVEIDHGIFRQLLDLPINRMPALGALLEKYKQILSYRDFLSSSYLLALADLPFLLLFMAVIALAAGPLVFVGIICGLLMLLVGFLQLAPVLDYDRQAKQASEERLDLLASAVTGREAIVGARLRGLLQHRWEQASLTAAAAASKSRYWRGMGASLNTVISYASFIGVLALGVYLVEARQITAGGLLSASMLTSRMMNIFASVNTLLLRYREFKLALQEMNKMLPAPSMPVRLKTSAQLRGAVRLDRVTCRLQTNSAPVLENVSLTIAPGEIIGVAGAPGAGKTTLLRLLAGVLQPDEGQVLIDDIPLAQLQPEVVAANIGFKPQDYALFGTMIEDCVFAGREPPTPEQRHEVLSHSGLARAFQENGLSWGTAIGPRGAHISGGQRQMVALARALAGNPTLLLLDEPTNGLDAPLENQLAQTLQQRAGRQTIIISTHSRAMLSICHRIIVVGQSRILADGPRSKVLVG